MSDDRELLELAARAAGIHGVWNSGYRLFETDVDGFRRVWNPLTDDGDALRLAVDLQMTLSLGPCVVGASTISGALNNHWFKQDTIEHDPHSATRRAIVRAAAEIGRQIID